MVLICVDEQQQKEVLIRALGDLPPPIRRTSR